MPFDRHPFFVFLRRYAAASSTLPRCLAAQCTAANNQGWTLLAPHSDGPGGNRIWPIPGYFNFGEFSGVVFKCRTEGSLSPVWFRVFSTRTNGPAHLACILLVQRDAWARSRANAHQDTRARTAPSATPTSTPKATPVCRALRGRPSGFMLSSARSCSCFSSSCSSHRPT